MFARERRVAKLSEDEYRFHSEIGSILVSPNELGQPRFTMSGAERRRDARGLKDHSVITLTVDYVFEHGGPACSQVMTMSQGSYRSVAVHIAGGTKRGNRVVVQVQGRGQVGERWGNSGDHRRVSLERFTRTDVRVPSFQPVRLPAFTPRSISVHLDDDSVGIDREYRPVTGGNRRRPRTISFRTFRGGLRRAESGGADRTAQCRDRQENRLVCGNGASIMNLASDERNKIVIAQPRVPRPLRIGRCIAHPYF